MMLEVLATIRTSPGTGVHRPHISESPAEKGRNWFLVPHFHRSLHIHSLQDGEPRRKM